MHAAITGSGKYKHIYIMRSYRKDDGKVSKRTYKDLGRFDLLLERFKGDKEALMAWAREEAAKATLIEEAASRPLSLELSPNCLIEKDKQLLFNVGYLFLQQLCYELRLDLIGRTIKDKYKFTYNISDILMDLIFARILAPASKRSSFKFCHQLLESPSYTLENIYRALSILANESDYIQAEMYRNSNFVHPRKSTVLYYDCTNYYFEIEQENHIKKYGKSKEHRPNPIVTMGLFMDSQGIPLAFDIFPGNQNEQTTLKPLESKIIRDFKCSEFIFCSDAGLGSIANRKFNSLNGRKYVITHSLKKLKQDIRKTALNPKFFKNNSSHQFIDISQLDESNPSIFNTVFYKEIPLYTNGREEILIVTYSPKYKAYQRRIRENQVNRALKSISSTQKPRTSRNINDPSRFITKTAITNDGEVAKKYTYELNEERIADEAQYDGFYAVVTNIDDDVQKIIQINKQRWQIEENFRIMKHEFAARPVHVQREDRIKAHFLTCYLALLVYRLLEKKLDNKYTPQEIIHTLQSMNVLYLPKVPAYTPAYQRTNITDELHTLFNFRTDYEVMRKGDMRHIKSLSKKRQ